MAVLTFDGIDDFVATTLDAYKRDVWTDISLEYQNYVSARLNREKKVEEVGGPQITFLIKTKNTGSARITGLYAEDTTNVEDLMVQGSVPWSLMTANFSYDLREDMWQSDRETLVRLLKIRLHAALCDIAELREQKLWSAPAATTDKSPLGVPFWLQKDATTTPAGAFNGGNPSGFTSGAAGISSTTYPAWRNWTFGYSAATQDDLVVKLKKAVVMTDFVCPVPHPELGFGNSDYEIFTTYRVTEPLERLAESRNDNLRADLAKYMNQVTVAGIPLRFVPYLEANDTSDPLYGVNWKTFRPFVKRGWNMRRGEPQPAPKQHNVRNVHIDHSEQYICVDRRRNFVGSKA